MNEELHALRRLETELLNERTRQASADRASTGFGPPASPPSPFPRVPRLLRWGVAKGKPSPVPWRLAWGELDKIEPPPEWEAAETARHEAGLSTWEKTGNLLRGIQRHDPRAGALASWHDKMERHLEELRELFRKGAEKLEREHKDTDDPGPQVLGGYPIWFRMMQEGEIDRLLEEDKRQARTAEEDDAAIQRMRLHFASYSEEAAAKARRALAELAEGKSKGKPDLGYWAELERTLGLSVEAAPPPTAPPMATEGTPMGPICAYCVMKGHRTDECPHLAKLAEAAGR